MARGTRNNLPEEVFTHYMEADEENRLLSGGSRIEFARTKEVIEEHVPAPPASILDVGGGPGTYAAWLAEKGYEVRLVDPVPLHVEQARRRSGAVTAMLGDARRLDLPDACVDAVLLLGPLYHLTEQNERVAALSEARRVVRPGGPVFAAAISRFASLFDSLKHRFIDDPVFRPTLERDLIDGQHRNPSGRTDWFTTAFFHRPEELEDEVERSGLDLVDLIGLEGPGWLLQDLDARWANPVSRDSLLYAARAVAHEPLMMAVSAHLLAVARAPERA